MAHPRDHTGWTDRGFLPHLDRPHLVQSVTFRLADSMPQDRRNEWQQILGLKNEPERIRKIEAWLDKGAGTCVLRDPTCAGIVQDALLHLDRQRYRLIAWCVMPNHVHVLLEILEGHPLGGLVHSWKTFTAREINGRLNRTGTLWQEDYFDRFIRDGTHLENEARYIEGNPVAAGLVKRAEDWPFSSARLRR